MSRSLRRTLLVGTLAIVTAIWIALAVSAWFETRREANELFDAHLAQTAQLLAVVEPGDAEEAADTLVESPPEHRYARHVAFQIWEGTRLAAHSASAPAVPLGPQGPGEQGFYEDARWRVFSTWNADRSRLIQVAETLDARNEVGAELAAHLLAPLALALPLLAFSLVLLIGHGLKPLSVVAASIGRRSPEHLEPIAMDDAPREIQPVLEQLNALLARLQRAIEQERNFTADAAHELRTPLAAMRIQAQVAQGSRDPAEREHALANLVSAATRAAQLIDQLLTIARLDALPGVVTAEAMPLRPIVADVIAGVAPDAIDKQVELVLTAGPDPVLATDAGLIGILLRNLIDNAVRYSPAHSTVQVSLLADAGEGGGDGTVIVIEDEGPGIPDASRQRVFDRFYRMTGTTESGAGLGLAIVARIATLLGAVLSMEPGRSGCGLCVRIRFPAARP